MRRRGTSLNPEVAPFPACRIENRTIGLMSNRVTKSASSRALFVVPRAVCVEAVQAAALEFSGPSFGANPPAAVIAAIAALKTKVEPDFVLASSVVTVLKKASSFRFSNDANAGILRVRKVVFERRVRIAKAKEQADPIAGSNSFLHTNWRKRDLIAWCNENPEVIRKLVGESGITASTLLAHLPRHGLLPIRVSWNAPEPDAGCVAGHLRANDWDGTPAEGARLLLEVRSVGGGSAPSLLIAALAADRGWMLHGRKTAFTPIELRLGDSSVLQVIPGETMCSPVAVRQVRGDVCEREVVLQDCADITMKLFTFSK